MNKSSHRVSELPWATFWGAVVVAAFALLIVSPATAQESGNDDPFWNNATCYQCHQQSGLTITLPSSETLNLAVFEGDYDGSVHGESGVSCRNCHLNITDFPHPDVIAATREAFTLELAGSCEVCHKDHYTKVGDELHEEIGGLACSNCHDPHTTGTGDVAAEVSLNCAECHAEPTTIPAEGIHAAPELPERSESVSGLMILGIAGGALVFFVVLVWLATVTWRSARQKS